MVLIVSIPARDGASFLKPFAGFNRLKSGVSGEVEKLKPLCRTELRTPDAAAAIATGPAVNATSVPPEITSGMRSSPLISRSGASPKCDRLSVIVAVHPSKKK